MIIRITNPFQRILDKLKRCVTKSKGCKPNKIWVDKGSKFYNRSMKSWLEKNVVEMYSAHNEGKSVVTERFIITLKNKIYKYMTSVSKNVYIDKLDDIVTKYNNTHHSTIKMKPVIVKSSTYIDSSKEINDKDPKFKVGDIVRISKYEHFLQKTMFQIVLKKVLWLKKFKNTVPLTYVISDLKFEEIVGTF